MTKDLLMWNIRITLAMAIAWLALFCLNPKIHVFGQNFPWISALFLPAGLRIYGAMLFREMVIPGLLIGNMLATVIASKSLPEALKIGPLAAGVISSLTPFLSLLIFEKVCNEDVDVLKIKMKPIALLKLVGIYAIVNGLAGCAYFKFSRDMTSIGMLDFFDMAMGDFFGAIIFLGIIYFLREPIKKIL